MSIMTQTDFAMIIEELALTEKLTYTEAVLRYCADNFIEPVEIAKMINGSLKDKIRMNFVEMGMLQKTAGMPGI